MRGQSRIGVESNWLVDRRSVLTGLLATWVSATCRAREVPGPRAEEDQELRAVEAIAATAGLRSFGSTRTAHYLGIGDASENIRSSALANCEAVAADYLAFYQSKGFKVAMPARRLTAIILTDEHSRGAFNAGPPAGVASAVRNRGQIQKGRTGDRGTIIPTETKGNRNAPGHYEPRTNRIVVSLHAKDTRTSGRLDLQLLAHEATHQLTFNTGLLSRQGDVPRCIAEGLAQYREIRNTAERTGLGQPHKHNLYVLVRARRFGPQWYPIAHLLAEDRSCLPSSGARTQSLAYAQAWLLIDYLMKDQSRLEGLRAYLEAIRPRRNPEHRLDDAKKHLGDLDRLDEDLVSYFVRLNKSL
jgi:hypothetical protein